MLSENPITVIPPGYETGLASMIDESKPTINGTKYLIPMGGILIYIKFMSIKYFQLGLL